MAHRPRSFVPFLAVLGLCAGACTSTNDAGYATADRILAEAEGVEPTATETSSAPEVLAATARPCEVETRQDEYGLEFEVCVDVSPPSSAPSVEPDSGEPDSGEPESAESNSVASLSEPELTTVLMPAERFDELVSAFPPGSGADELVELGRALSAMDQACQVSLEYWGVELAIVTEQLQLVAEAVVGDPALVEVLGQPEGRELAQAVVERVMIPSGCVDAASDSSPIGGLDEDSLAELAAAAAAAVEPLYQALWGQPKSPFFYHPDELAHRQWLRDEALLGTDLELVVAGTSQTLLGVEADLLGEQLGLESGSVALPGAVAEVQQYWLPEVVEAAEPSVVLWGIGPLDLVTICAPDGRAEEFVRLSRLKQDLFSRIPAAQEIPALDLVIGPPGSTAYAESPTSRALDRRFPQPRGDAFEFAQPDPNELRLSLEQFRAPFERGDFCTARLPVIEATIASLVKRGHQVVVFGMPIAPSLAATYDGGREALTQLVDQAAADVFEPAGAEYLGMMTSIDDDGFWYDVVHPTRAGGEALTAELAEALGAGDPAVEIPPPGFN